jgi:hypothetical protein
MLRLVAVLGALVPGIARAAEGDFWGPIVPACAYTAGKICVACDLVTMVDNLLRVFVTLSVFAAIILFVYSGILFVTASWGESNLASAKKIFWKTLIGFLFVIGAFLIVDLTLKASTNQSFKVWTTIRCVYPEETKGVFTWKEDPTDVRSVDSPIQGSQGPQGPAPAIAQCAAGTGLTHQAALARLNATGKVHVTSTSGDGGVKDGCSGKGCTTLANICEQTLAGMEGIAKDSPCGKITIWGATEGGDAHGDNSWHGKGCAFDIAPASGGDAGFACLGNWLKQNGAKYGVTQVCTTPGDSAYRQNCTYNEGPRHFHVTFCKK